MDKLAQVRPEHLGMVAVVTIAFLVLRAMWDWRGEIFSRLPHRSVNTNRPDYGNTLTDESLTTTATEPVAATTPEARNVIAMERNDDNAALTRNGGNVVLRARAEIIARLLKSEMLYTRDSQGGYRRITQTWLIELATGLRPNGRPDSDYGQLHAELKPLIDPTMVISPGRPDERVISK